MNNFDFILAEERANDERLIFRFNPDKSRCHSFNDDPPKTWKEVYKVYYTWSIFKEWNDGDRIPIFYIDDECSVLTELAYHIRVAIENNKTITTIASFGQPGSEWTLELIKGGYMKFTVFENVFDKGCRFWLKKDKALKFADY